MKRLPILILILLLTSGCTADISSLLYTVVSASEPQTLAGDPARGEDLYRHGVEGAPPCISCHALEPGAFALAPDLHGVAARAGERIAGLAADDYIHQSIVEPRAFVVPGFRDLMYPAYADSLEEEDIQDLIAFLHSL
jgi:mono/diheme cytochrome c family protein